jgi:hypothetical protein
MRKLFMFRFPEGENEITQPAAEETQADIAAETEVAETTEDAPEDDAPADEEGEG